MESFELLIILLFGATGLCWLAKRFQQPYPIALMLGGIGLGMIPSLPEMTVEPKLLLAIILPPILYRSAIFMSWRDFRHNLRPIILMAVGLVLATTISVAYIGNWLAPEIGFTAFFLLGAIISPPDAVSAASVIEKLRVPKRVATILEGESLINDASGLVLYGLALAAITHTRTIEFEMAVIDFVRVGAGGILVGFLLAQLTILWHRRMESTEIEILLSLITPFICYFVAEHFHVSGVLAVVTAGLVRGRYSPSVFNPEMRMQALSTWNTINYVLNCFIFILIGLHLRPVFESLPGNDIGELIILGLWVSLIAIISRIGWVFLFAWLPRVLSPKLRKRDPFPGWKKLLVIGWAGMRGVVSLAIALALPVYLADGSVFEFRSHLLVMAYVVIFITLVGQGLTLGPLIHMLGIEDDGVLACEENEARIRTIQRVLELLEDIASAGDYNHEMVAALRLEYQERLNRLQNHTGDINENIKPDTHGRLLRLIALAEERSEILYLHRTNIIGDDVLHILQRELDLAELHLR